MLKKRNKSNVFWYVSEFIYWKCIEHTTHWNKTQMSKNKCYRKCPHLSFAGYS